MISFENDDSAFQLALEMDSPWLQKTQRISYQISSKAVKGREGNASQFPGFVVTCLCFSSSTWEKQLAWINMQCIWVLLFMSMSFDSQRLPLPCCLRKDQIIYFAVILHYCAHLMQVLISLFAANESSIKKKMNFPLLLFPILKQRTALPQNWWENWEWLWYNRVGFTWGGDGGKELCTSTHDYELQGRGCRNIVPYIHSHYINQPSVQTGWFFLLPGRGGCGWWWMKLCIFLAYICRSEGEWRCL